MSLEAWGDGDTDDSGSQMTVFLKLVRSAFVAAPKCAAR